MKDASNNVVRVTMNLIRAGAVQETFADLKVSPGAPDDLFEAINSLFDAGRGCRSRL